MAKQIFVNLPVKNLQASIDFFTKLGFTFNPQFTDENATCMIIGDNIFAMLLVEKFFNTFTTKKILDTKSSVEVILAISVESREAVDHMVNTAKEAGGKEPRESQDHGWMYSRTFEDIDGHTWEALAIDESQVPGQ